MERSASTAAEMAALVGSADVPGLRDSARDGQTGLLYPYGDIAALTHEAADVSGIEYVTEVDHKEVEQILSF